MMEIDGKLKLKKLKLEIRPWQLTEKSMKMTKTKK